MNPETTNNKFPWHFDEEKSGRFLEFASAAELLIFLLLCDFEYKYIGQKMGQL